MSRWTRHGRYMYRFQTETLSKFILPWRLNQDFVVVIVALAAAAVLAVVVVVVIYTKVTDL